METFDSQLEERVWQRVRGEDGLPGVLKSLTAREWAEAASLLMLSRQLPGKEKTVLRKLFEQDQAHAACLRGMHLLITGEPLAPRTSPPVPEPPETALRKCYGRKLRAAGEYASRAGDPEYGSVFSQLARQEQEHCRILLELMGDLRK